MAEQVVTCTDIVPAGPVTAGESSSSAVRRDRGTLGDVRAELRRGPRRERLGLEDCV